MEKEEKFFASLFFIATHLIKNADSLSKVLVPLVESWETKQWAALPLQKKQEIVTALSKAVDESGLIGKHFKDYPHQYTKRKYNEFCVNLVSYSTALSQGLT